MNSIRQLQHKGHSTNTYSELSLVVEDLHTPADIRYFVYDGFSTTSLNNINQQKLL